MGEREHRQCSTFQFTFNLKSSLISLLQLCISVSGYALSDLNNLLVIINAATTSIFYMKFSSRYRSAVKLILYRLFCPTRYHQYVSTTQYRTCSCPTSELISRPGTRSNSSVSQPTRHLSFSPILEKSDEKNFLNPYSSPINRRRSCNDQRDIKN